MRRPALSTKRQSQHGHCLPGALDAPPSLGEAAKLFADAGFDVAALALDDNAVSLREYASNRPDRVAIMLGTEGDGLSRGALSAATTTVTIPMLHGVDSLNVAAASAVALYALTG